MLKTGIIFLFFITGCATQNLKSSRTINSTAVPIPSFNIQYKVTKPIYLSSEKPKASLLPLEVSSIDKSQFIKLDVGAMIYFSTSNNSNYNTDDRIRWGGRWGSVETAEQII